MMLRCMQALVRVQAPCGSSKSSYNIDTSMFWDSKYTQLRCEYY